jgi:hypothetical protein
VGRFCEYGFIEEVMARKFLEEETQDANMDDCGL